MKNLGLTVRYVGLFAGLSVSLAGCQNNTQTGAAWGTGLGALTGAIIGHQSGHKEAGALIGALAGGVGGGLLGNAKDREEERDHALSYAHNQELTRQAAERAVTNGDVIAMTQKGLSDDYVIRTIKMRGGRFDTSPNAAIYLREQGVSEYVLLAMQQYGMTR